MLFVTGALTTSHPDVLLMNNVVAITTDGVDLWLPERF
jgi:hypothetical protein